MHFFVLSLLFYSNHGIKPECSKLLFFLLETITFTFFFVTDQTTSTIYFQLTNDCNVNCFVGHLRLIIFADIHTFIHKQTLAVPWFFNVGYLGGIRSPLVSNKEGKTVFADAVTTVKPITFEFEAVFRLLQFDI